jgi:hypothetical protein
MSEPKSTPAPETVTELLARISRLEEKLKQAENDKREALELRDEMREALEDSNALIDRWIEVFDMTTDENGVYHWPADEEFDKLNDDYGKLLDDYNTIVKKWNKLVPEWNTMVAMLDAKTAKRPRGRPLHASPAQVQRVRMLRAESLSLRRIASNTGLAKSTVENILKESPLSRPEPERETLVRRAHDKLRAAKYRARQKARAALAESITATTRRNAALIKAAKGHLAAERKL